MLRVQNQDDSRAFGLLVRRWQDPILRLCTRMTGDRHLGEDLAQETFARLLVHAKSYRHGARVSTFLWRIAMNLCCDERRKASRRSAALLGREDEGTPNGGGTLISSEATPDVLLARRESAELVRDALARLPEHYRSVVVLRHYEELKFREIAEVLEIPEGTVKSRMAEALSRLGRLLGPALGGDAT